MITDRGKSYDAEELSEVAQQKCLAHLLRNASKVIERKSGPARQFGLKLKVLLREGLTLWHARGTLDGAEFERRRQQLDGNLTHHLRNRILKDDDNQTFGARGELPAHAREK